MTARLILSQNEKLYKLIVAADVGRELMSITCHYSTCTVKNHSIVQSDDACVMYEGSYEHTKFAHVGLPFFLTGVRPFRGEIPLHILVRA